MKKYARRILLILPLFACFPAMASHIVGGVMTYEYLGDTTISGIVSNKYEVTLTMYIDYINGQPEAIAQDDPAFFSLYIAGILFEEDTTIFYNYFDTLPYLYTNTCGSILKSSNLLKRTFVKEYYLPPATADYTIVYQRCCMNTAIVNINNPGDNGVTYYCTIPATPVTNSSAIFKNEPPQQVCLNMPLHYDHSATDADGDSLSYGLCTGLVGADDANIKPIPLQPPYDSVTYLMPYNSQYPMDASPGIQVDPVTGMITGTPTKLGTFLASVYCNEWRGGVLINTIRREFEFVVTPCKTTYTPDVWPDTTIYAGDSVQFNAMGATSYSWTPGTYLSHTAIANPVGHFPVGGMFTYIIHAVSDSGCTGNDTLHVQVLDYSEFKAPNAFTPNGDGINDLFVPIPVLNSTLVSMKIYDRNWHLIYTGDSQSPGWDGTYKGTRQPMGAYYWQVVYIDNTGATRTTGGSVTLIR